MFSTVTYPQPSSPPQPSIRELAAAGYFRAIALWLNEPLAPQGIYIKVQAHQPGCLRLTVEFNRPPIKEHLLRYLCHQVWLLNSDLIEGIHVVARPVGRRRIVWEKRIRIVTPALKRRKTSSRVAHPAQQNSPLPPPIRHPMAHLSRQRLKTLRALILTGSAVAAFVFGCLLEVVTTGSGPILPSFSARSLRPAALESVDNQSPDHSNLVHDPQATTIDYRAADPGRSSLGQTAKPTPGAPQARPTVVDAALEPVGVIQHHLPENHGSDAVTLIFGGDIALEDLAYDELAEAGGLFTHLEEYQQADLALVTLGAPLATAATTLEEELYERNRPDAVNLLAESGVDIVNLADNNLMRHGDQGLDETLQALDSKGIYRVGAGRNETEARRPEIIDVKGKRIAYLSYSMGGDNAAFGSRAGTNAQETKEIIADIRALRDEVDWIVVNYRWVDYVTEEPNFKQTNLARMAIEQGADVVVGYHPNVIQGAEVYRGRPIAYSVGDFVFESGKPLADQDSAMLKVSLKQDQMKVEFVPVRVQNSLPKTLEGPEAKAVLQKIEQASQQFDEPMQSPMVLDLKKAPTAPETYDPASPFVSPKEADTLPVESVEPSPVTEPVAPAEKGSEQPANPGVPATAEPGPVELDLLEELNQLNDKLPEWGPKPSQGQQKFKPIPQNRPENQEEMDALLQPNLLRRLQQPQQNLQGTAVPATEAAPVRSQPIWRENSGAETPSAVPPAPAETRSLNQAVGEAGPAAISPAGETGMGSLSSRPKPQPVNHPEPKVLATSTLLSQLASAPVPGEKSAVIPLPNQSNSTDLPDLP